MVQLKGYNRVDIRMGDKISIPHGTIKRPAPAPGSDSE